MQWRSVEFGNAGGITGTLAPAEVDAEVGILSRLTMLPSLIGARNNPDGKTLQDVVPPDLYARWLVLKAKYLGDADNVEKWRPLFAAFELYRKAISKSGLERSDELLPVVTKLARKRGLQVTTPEVTVKVESRARRSRSSSVCRSTTSRALRRRSRVSSPISTSCVRGRMPGPRETSRRCVR
jgi:hypothetical protein